MTQVLSYLLRVHKVLFDSKGHKEDVGPQVTQFLKYCSMTELRNVLTTETEGWQ